MTHLKNYNSTSLIARRQQVTIVIELHARNDIGIGNIIV